MTRHSRHTTVGAVAAALAAAVTVGEVQLPSHAAEPPAEKMDCRVYENRSTKLGLSLEFGAMLLPLLDPVSPSASVTPSVSFERKTGVAWDKAAHGLVARYVELCTRYNAGLVTKEEYAARMSQIEGIHKEMQGLEAKVFEETRSHAQSAHDELDRALSRGRSAKPGTSVPVADTLDSLNRRIEQLDTAR